MRFLSLLFLSVLFLIPSVAFSEGKYDLSKNCEACHKEIVSQWKGSAHGLAHFSKDEFFGKVMKVVAQKTQKEIGVVQEGCLSCHAQRVEGPLSGDIALEGVGCSLCHRISGIEHSSGKGSSPAGGTLLWLSDGQFAGPSSESNAPHGTVQSALFAGDADKLCLLCHEELKNPKGVVLCTTGGEHASSQSGKRCVDCHMTEGGKKTHAFRGARNSDILKEAVELSTARKDASLSVTLRNISSHKFPTGNPARSVIVSVDFRKGTEVLGGKKEILNAIFLDEEGKQTLAPLSSSAGKDSRLKPDEVREYLFPIPEGATVASVKVLYRIMPDALAEKLQVKDESFLKAYPVIAKEIVLN
ncbi:MAG: hypothetical protein HGA78_05725 [Nitrospirales bacterium]|nr:hypothetical protein [Nitrospirales bacterium]